MKNKEDLIKSFKQTWDKPSKLSPIIIIGCGGIVKDAHLPAYQKGNFEVAGLFDVDISKAQSLADEYKISNVFSSLEEALSNSDAIFDLALPPANLLEVVENFQKIYLLSFKNPLVDH